MQTVAVLIHLGLAHVYTATKSSTYVANGKSFSITYGDGTKFSGTLSNDTLTIAGITVKSQTFAEITTQTKNFNVNPVVDGLMGMAHQSIANSGSVPPFINMINQNPSLSPVFSFYLNSLVTNSK